MKKDVAFLVLLAVLALAFTWPLVLHLNDHFPHDMYDAGYCVWAMNWTIQALTHNPAALPDGNIFYPHRGTLFYADAVIGLALLGAPFALISGNPLLAHNLLLILSFWIAGAGMYFLARRLTGRRSAAVLAALIFAFFPYTISHIMHLELLFYGLIPFCLLFIHRFFDDPSWKNTFGIGFFFILQVLCCAYYAVYIGLGAGALFLVFLLRDGRWKKGVFRTRAAGLAVLLAVFLGPYVLAYASVHRHMLFGRSIVDVKAFSPEVQNIILPPDWNKLWGWFAGRPPQMEKLIYPGLVPLILTGAWFAAIFRKARKRRKEKEGDVLSGRRRRRFIWDAANLVLFLFIVAVGITGGFEMTIGGGRLSVRSLSNPVWFLLLSLALRILTDPEKRKSWAEFFRAMTPVERFYGGLVVCSWLLAAGPVIRLFGRDIIAGPYAFLYYWMPGFSGLRTPGRFVVLAVLGMAVLSAYVAAGIPAKWKTGRRKVFLVVGLAAVLAADCAFGPIPLVRAETRRTLAPIYGEVNKLPAEAVLVELPLPPRRDVEYEDALPTYRSIFHGRRLLNGYSGYTPPAYRIVREAMERFPNRRTFDLLENLNVGYFLVHTTGFRADKGAITVGRLKDFSRRATLLREMNGDYLYRLEPVRRTKAAVPPVPRRIVGDVSIWKAQASRNPQAAGAAFDGDPRTAWSTGYHPQSKSDYFSLDLGRAERFRRLEMRLDRNPFNYPRGFAVDVSADGIAWREIAGDPGFFPDLSAAMVEDFSKYVVPADFSRVEARFLRVRLTGRHEYAPWTISEIVLLDD
ncbi:MAG: discoidin domain-containing protein [Candidatus Aminicenantales bacterium]